MDGVVIPAATARALALLWLDRGDKPPGLGRFVATGQIEADLIARVGDDVALLRQAWALQPPLTGASAEAAGSVSTAQLTVLHAYLQAHGPRGPQPDWPPQGPVDLRVLADPLDRHATKERNVTMSSGQDMDIYQRLGGAEQGPANVAAVVDRFYELVVHDPALLHYFEGVNLRRLKMHQRQFLTAALGGPEPYEGRGLRDAHARLGISDEHFTRVVTHLVHALGEFHVDPDTIQAIGRKLAPLRSQIVTHPGAGGD
jgi:hemoglobin